MVVEERHVTAAIACVAMILISTVAIAQDIDSSVDRREVSLGEPVVYTVITHDPVRRVQPPDGDNFRVVGQSTLSSFKVANGHVSRVMKYRFSLVPLKTGTWSTGASRIRLHNGTTVRGKSYSIKVTGKSQNPTIQQRGRAHSQVGAVRPSRSSNRLTTTDDRATVPAPGSKAMFSSGIPTDAGRRPFLMTAITDNNPYVGQQVVVDYLFYTPVTGFGLSAQGLEEPNFSNIWFEDQTLQRRPGRGSAVDTKRIGGRLYEVHLLRSFQVVPLKPGSLTIPPVSLSISRTRLLHRGAQEELHSPPLDIQIQELPSKNKPATFSAGNVGSFSLSADIENTTLKVGETARVHVSIEGFGVSSRMQAPHIELPNSFTRFPPEDHTESLESSTGWLKTRLARTVAFTPTQEGEFQPHDIVFHYFDPWDKKYKTERVELPKIIVSGSIPGGNAQNSPNKKEDANAPNPGWIESLPANRTNIPTTSDAGWLKPFKGGIEFFSMLALPFFLIGGTALFRRISKIREKNSPQRERRNIRRKTIRAIENLDGEPSADAGELARLLRNYVSVKTDSSCRGSTIEKLRQVAGQHFGRRGFKLGSLIEEAELYRYGGNAEDDIATLTTRAIAMIQELDAHQGEEP